MVFVGTGVCGRVRALHSLCHSTTASMACTYVCTMTAAALSLQVWTTVPPQQNWATPHFTVQEPITDHLQLTEDGEESAVFHNTTLGGSVQLQYTDPVIIVCKYARNSSQ